MGHCTLCHNSQYVGKSEPPAHHRFNGHRSDVNSMKGCPFDHHFALPGHDFDKHARFVLIEQINDKDLTKLETRALLESREDFWIERLRTIQPHGHNDRYNSTLKQTLHTVCK